MAKAHILYRFWAVDGSLLYIGLTMDPGTRWKAHRHTQPWWATVAKITVEHFPDRVSVTIAEATAIKTEKPKHNISGTGANKNKNKGKRRTAVVSTCPRGCDSGYSSTSDSFMPCSHPNCPWRAKRTARQAASTATLTPSATPGRRPVRPAAHPLPIRPLDMKGVDVHG